MKKLLLALLLCAGFAMAQTSVTITITVPSAAVPVMDAWRATQCGQMAVNGACAAPKYADLVTMLKAVIAQAIADQMSAPSVQWAVATKDASLPTSIKNAIANATSAQLVVDAVSTAKLLVAATTITVQ